MTPNFHSAAPPGHLTDASTNSNLRQMCLAFLAVALPISIYFCVSAFSYAGDDLQHYVLPWINHISEYGRLKSLEGSYSNYTPPYLYLLSLGSSLDIVLSPVTIIKSISIIFALISGMLVFKIARMIGRSPAVSVLCGAAFINLPTIVLDTVVWGQCDTIYTTFLLAFAYAALKGRSFLCVSMLAVALTFKLQSIFVGPFVGYLILTGVIRLRHLLIIPVVYAAAMLPAWLAGRPWFDLLTIYLHQTGFYDRLSMNAPNPYLWFETVIQASPPAAVTVGLAIAAASNFALLLSFLYRGRVTDSALLLTMLVLSLVVMPYTLPKMHERYFLPADIFALVLVVARPSTWPIMTLLQLASILSYGNFLFNYLGPVRRLGIVVPIVASFALTLGLGFLVATYIRSADRSSRRAGPLIQIRI